MLQNWPILKTTRPVPSGLRIRALLSACAAVILVPIVLALCAMTLSNISAALGWESTADVLNQLFVLMYMSLIGTIPSLLPTIPLALIALHLGRAGWLCALIAGGLVSCSFFTAFMGFRPDRLFLTLGFGVAFGALFWLGARLAAPAAFVARDTPGKNT